MPAEPASDSPSVTWSALREGIRDAAGLPALMLMASLVGVGGLARDIGYPLGAGVLSTVLIWAAPGQMVLFGTIASGAALPAVAVAVSLSSVRFLPMTMALLPLMRRPGTPTWVLLLISHYVAITAWVHSMRVMPDMAPERRIPYFFGFANTVLVAAALATGAGYYLIGQLPAALAAGLLLTSPGRGPRRRHAGLSHPPFPEGPPREGGCAMIAWLEHASGGLWPYLVIILFGFLPSEIWRWLAVFLGRGIDENSEILVWVRAVASALLAGVVAKLILTPTGALATIPLFWRVGSLVAGVAGFYLARRSILAGVIAGEIVLIGAGLAFSG